MHKLICNNIIYKSKRYQIAIKIDKLDYVALAYDYIDEQIIQESEGILTTLDSFIAQELEKSLGIDAKEYGIEITYELEKELEDIW